MPSQPHFHTGVTRLCSETKFIAACGLACCVYVEQGPVYICHPAELMWNCPQLSLRKSCLVTQQSHVDSSGGGRSHMSPRRPVSLLDTWVTRLPAVARFPCSHAHCCKETHLLNFPRCIWGLQFAHSHAFKAETGFQWYCTWNLLLWNNLRKKAPTEMKFKHRRSSRLKCLFWSVCERSV